jgi:hypothetical protein
VITPEEHDYAIDRGRRIGIAGLNRTRRPACIIAVTLFVTGLAHLSTPTQENGETRNHTREREKGGPCADHTREREKGGPCANHTGQIHILSPNLVNVWTYDRAVTSIVHEFAHTVTLRVNPTFANNPRWLWESVALYEAGQFVDPRGLSYMTSGQPPTFDQLSAIEDTRVYDVGYVIAEFIVATWGEPGLIALVRQNGNPAAVGAAPEEFRVRWLTFLRDRYGL